MKLGDWRVQLALQILLIASNGYLQLLSVLGDDYKILTLFLTPALQSVSIVVALYINPNGTPAYTFKRKEITNVPSISNAISPDSDADPES